MASRRTKKEAEPAESGGSAEPEPAEADGSAEPEPAEESQPAPEAGFENRAARRARNKGAQPPKAAGKIEPHGRRAPIQAPRSWANRRSG